MKYNVIQTDEKIFLNVLFQIAQGQGASAAMLRLKEENVICLKYSF